MKTGKKFDEAMRRTWKRRRTKISAAKDKDPGETEDQLTEEKTGGRKQRKNREQEGGRRRGRRKKEEKDRGKKGRRKEEKRTYLYSPYLPGPGNLKRKKKRN